MTRLAAVAAAVVLASCGGSSPATTSGPPTLPPGTPAASATATTHRPPTGAATLVASTVPAECERPVGSVTGDFDGDGTADTAYVVDLVLMACLADGSSSLLDVGGMGEVLLAVDLQGDGVDEILVGGTTAWGQGADVVVVDGGRLAPVLLDGERLAVWRGIPPDGVLDFGCLDEDGDGRREVILVEGEIDGGDVLAVRRVIAVDGTAATELFSATATLPLTGAGDVLAEPGLRELAGGDC